MTKDNLPPHWITWGEIAGEADLAQFKEYAEEFALAAIAAHDAKREKVLMNVLASLVAAISLLERGGRLAAPSDKMFEQMLADYRGAVERARAYIEREGACSQ